MLTIVIEAMDLFDEESNTFSRSEEIVMEMEHSLLSLSKWESKYQKPFLTKDEKSKKEIFDYLKAMVVTPGVDLDALYTLPNEKLIQIQEYIDSKESATTFGELPDHRGPNEVITSELIYFWMFSFQIPIQCETWHLNRLFSLIRIFGIKNSKPKKMSAQEVAMRNREINEQRRRELGTRG